MRNHLLMILGIFASIATPAVAGIIMAEFNEGAEAKVAAAVLSAIIFIYLLSYFFEKIVEVDELEHLVDRLKTKILVMYGMTVDAGAVKESGVRAAEEGQVAQPCGIRVSAGVVSKEPLVKTLVIANDCKALSKDKIEGMQNTMLKMFASALVFGCLYFIYRDDNAETLGQVAGNGGTWSLVSAFFSICALVLGLVWYPLFEMRKRHRSLREAAKE
ncbi:MAG: hypothetical protein ACMVY4_02895 [Minwuia sp.]|uniref:hypothetical protein n=1 Tax=Minwuia sp. TaxID=2493630 RepID=UPI003A83F988